MVLYRKRRRVQALEEAAAGLTESSEQRVIVKFADATNKDVGDDLEIPISTTAEDLKTILKTYLTEEEQLQDYSLVLAECGREISVDVMSAFAAEKSENDTPLSTEGTLRISFYSKAPFTVRPVTRLAGSLKGHRGTILCTAFAPNSQSLATGSGDCTVRLWDLLTATPICALRGHTAPVVSLAWSPDGRWLATGSEDRTVRVWAAQECNSTSQAPAKILKLHKDTVTCLQFMPAHLHKYWRMEAPLLLSAGRDGSAVVWDVVRGMPVAHLHGHLKMITAARWSGMSSGSFDCSSSGEGPETIEGPFIYTSSRDMSVRVWHGLDGRPLANVRCHGHWVNSLSCNTDGVMKFGPFDERGTNLRFNSFSDMTAAATQNWEKAWKNLGEERIVTSSDDNTLSLWTLMQLPLKTSRYEAIARMTGHQKAVCWSCFSPNGRYIVSAGFDSAIRLWDGRSGKFLHTFRGHVGPVYQLSWAADSRFFVSCSRDSTLKVWDTIEGGRKLSEDLPGAADEIYAVEWSPDCSKVASGGKDRILRLWAH